MTSCERMTNSAAETNALGRQLGELLFAGAVVALVGPMGAGKTTLTRAIAAGLGADERQVSSPTFTLVHEYEGRIPVYHFDTYRLPNLAAFLNLGTGEYLQGDGVCIIEWADRVEAALPESYLRVTIELLDADRRRFQFQASGPGYEDVVRRLRTQNN